MKYRIRNAKDTSLYWSNSKGWVDYDSADVYISPEPNMTLPQNLPVNGEWFSCYPGNEDKLPYLLTVPRRYRLVGSGNMGTTPLTIKELLEMSDLSNDEVDSIEALKPGERLKVTDRLTLTRLT